MAGYSARQSTFTTGDTITAAHSNNEFNAILAAFHVSTGHKHDGSTAGDGGPISTLFSNAISMGTGADTDIALTFNANTNDGVITWMEDEDYFQFSDDILISTTEKLQFRDTAIYINSSADGQLDLVADTEIQIAATTIDMNGNVDVSGTLVFGSLGDGTVTITDIADEDNMSSNSATKLATQQSIKAYVDATVTAEDLDVTSDSGTIAIDLDSETLTIAGGTGLDSSATSNTVTLAIDSTVSTLTGSQTLTNKTLTSPVVNTGVSGTAIADEDDMSSNSATKLATQQSIKAYVDGQVSGVSSTWTLEDDDGTEVGVASGKEVKFIGSGITTNWTDTDNGTDADPYDMTFTVDAAQTGITSILATDLKIGEDNETKIDFEEANEIHFYAANAEQVYVADGIFGPQTDSDVDLGATGVRWKDAFVDSLTITDNITVGGDLTVNGTTTTVNSTTVTIDDPIFTLGGDSAPGSDDNKDRGIEFRWHNGSGAKLGFFGYDDSASAFTFIPDATNSSEVFSGTAGNVVFGNITGTLQTAAQTNITSVGALDGGSITSGFGAIDVGSSNITTTGAISGGTLAGTLNANQLSGTVANARLDAELQALAGLTSAADKGIQFTGSGTAGVYDLTAAGKALLDDADAAAQRTTLGLGTAATTAATAYATSAQGTKADNAAAKASNLSDLASASTARTNLGLGTAATLTAGTSANNAVQLDGSAKLPAVDGSALTNVVAGGIINKVADGAIAIRKPVVLTAAGKAKEVAETTSLASSPTAVFSTMDNSDTTTLTVSTTYEPNSGAYAMVYLDSTNSSYGTCVCGTWSDGTITWGTPVVFESSAIDGEPHVTSGGNRIHVTYKASDGQGGIRSASISGTTPTFAAETVWGVDAGTLGTTELSTTHATAGGKTIDTVYDTTSDRFVTIYADAGNSNYGTAVVHYISNTGTGATTYGTPVVFESGDISDNGKGATIAADTNTSRVVVAFRDGGDSSNGKAIVGSVTSGTNAISFGTAATFNAAHTQYPTIVEDPNTNKQAIFYRNFGGDSGHGYGIVGTVTGGTDNSIAFGTATEFHGVDTQEIAAAYEPDTNKILVVYADVPSSGQITGQSNVATISGTSISFGSQDQWEPQRPVKVGMAYDETANKFVIAYNNQNESGHGYMIVGTMSGTDMTYGSDVKYEANSVGDLVVGYNPGAGKCYIMSINGGDNDLRMETISISGTTPSNSTLVVDTNQLNSSFIGTAYDSDNGFVVVTYAYNSDNDLKTSVMQDSDGFQPSGFHIAYDTANDYVVVAFKSSIGGSSTGTHVRAISHNTGNGTYTAVGTKVQLHTGIISSAGSDLLYDPDANRTIIAYTDGSNSDYLTTNVIQTGGTAASPTVTLGSDVVIDTGDVVPYLAITYDTTNNKVFIAYKNSGDGKIRGAIGTVTAGTNAISFTTPADIYDYPSGDSAHGNIFDVIYDDDKDKVMFFYEDNDNSDYLAYKIITSGASSFSVADGATISSSNNKFGSGAASFGAGKGVLVGTRDAGNSSKVSYATTRFVASTTTNLDNGNYLGIAAEAISDTATGKINVIGGTSTGHSSLTIGNHYFTNGAGAIGLVGNTLGEQYLGKAISATEIQLLENEGYLYGTAEGAVTAGKPIFVEADGDFFTPTSSTTTTTFSKGTRTEILAATVNTVVANDFDVSAERFVVVYLDSANSNRTSAKLITVGSDKAIAVTATQELTTTSYGMENSQIIYDPTAEKMLVVYKSGANSNDLRCKVLTIGATSITVGSEVIIDDANNSGTDVQLCYDTTNSKIIVYVRDQSNSGYPTAYVGSISGTTPSFGAGQVVNSEAATEVHDCLFGNDNFLFTYEDSDNDGSARFATLSGTTLSFTTEFEWETNNPSDFNAKAQTACYDSVNDRFVITYRTSETDDPLYAKVLAKDGSTGTSGTRLLIGSTTNNRAGLLRKSNLGVVPVCYQQSTDIYYTELTVDASDNSLTKITGVLIGENISGMQSALALDSTNTRLLNIFEDNYADDLDGVGIIPNASITTTTFPTSGKGFLGFATKTVANDAQVEVATVGQIDAQQSGLTAGETYFAQSDGSLSTSADTLGSVTAGKALSATKLLIQ